jgi:NADPH-dependent curcumin reductase CurA
MGHINRQIVLAARPVGLPNESDFKLVEEPVPELAHGELLVRTTFLSVDPYMRGRMNERKSYATPVQLGEVMTGGTTGRVVESRNPKFNEGETVVGQWGWQQFAVTNGEGLRRTIPGVPISAHLGIVGMPGLTAYFGFLEICQPRAGETVLISGAGGAVGSLVGQIAKIKDCRAVGIAGSDEKVQWITDELGFDAAFNYKTAGNLVSRFRDLCPDGIDCYFDNVGGPITDAVFAHINSRARVAVCGQISQYNATETPMGPRLFGRLVEKQARVEGFLVFQFADKYPQGLSQLAEWVKSGRIKYRESVIDGIENAPRAFLGMLQGENIGKQLVRISEA